MDNYVYINEVEIFLWKIYKKKKIKLIDIYFSYLFKDDNFLNSQVIMLFAFLLSYSLKIGNICIFIKNILDINVFDNLILSFLDFFFKKRVSIFDCISILYKNNVISSYFQKNNTPFIFYKDNIYLNRFWVCETEIVKFIKKNFFKDYFIKKKNILYILKYCDKFKMDVYQKISILNVFFNKISIISGCPGTGKTTLISKLILILYKFFKFKNKNNIKIISYTGKSVSNLTNSLKKNFKLLVFDNNLIKLLPNKAITIHKFLNLNYKEKNYLFKNNILDIKILIVDESSMVSFYLFFNIIKLLKNNFIKIIFLGDSNQIGSIDPGSFFNDICNCKYSLTNYEKELLKNLYILKFNFKKININLNKLNNNVVFLKKNYRFLKNKNLLKISHFINIGNYNIIDDFIKKNNLNCNFVFYDSKKFNYNFFLNFCIKKYKYYIDFINKNDKKYNFFKIFNKFQIITVLKNTFLGTLFINYYINNKFKNKVLKKLIYSYKKKIFYYGEPILINKNNYDLNLYNGDLGFIVFLKNRLQVLFNDFYKNYRLVYIKNIYSWDNPWSITIHKSQGSEFDNIFIVFPDYFSNLLNRELVYTAFTRAKKKVFVYSDKDIFFESIKRKKKTFNNFLERL